MSQNIIWRSLPTLAAGLMVAAAPILVAWNVGIGALFPSLRLEVGRRLIGAELSNVTPPDPVSAFVRGSAQQFVATSALRAMPFRPFLTRLNNEVGFSILHQRRFGAVEVGLDGALYERRYREEYCSRNLAEFEARAKNSIAMLKDIQGALTGAGKKFVYLITPNKISVYPEYLADAPCPSPEMDRLGVLPLYRRMLDEAGVNYIDTASLITAKRHEYEIDLWPRGGTHWMPFAATLAVNQLIDWVNKHQGRPVLSTIESTYTIGRQPSGYDNDILQLLNLLLPHDDYPVFVPTFSMADSEMEKNCAQLKIGEIGGSLLYQFNGVLMTTRCVTIYNFFYWIVELVEYSNGKSFPARATNNVGPNDHALLLDCDVILLEENEEFLGKAGHVKAFHNFIMSARRPSPN
jgi:alginate O-acetyltransferase complex protein AlgJ